jgi:hypothetical protein
LPPHWRTLYELTRLEDDKFEELERNGIIPDMARAEDVVLLAYHRAGIEVAAVPKGNKHQNRTPATLTKAAATGRAIG